jgi:tetratricopeptide (TPR) repeat protein
MPENALDSDSSPGLKTILRMSAVPALFSMIVYANTLGNGLAYDDFWTMEALADFDLSLRNLFQMRGLTYTVHKLDVALWGDWVPGLHITNVLLHSPASALAAISAFAVSRSLRIGLLCGVIFSVHPVHTESVASFAYRKDILAMIFVSLALIIWVTSRRPLLRYSGTVVCYGLAMMSKEVAALALPIMLFLADLLPVQGGRAKSRQRFKRAAIRFVPLLVLGLIVATLTVSGLTASYFQSARPWVPTFAVKESGPSSLAKNISAHFTPEFIHLETEEQCQDYEGVLATITASIPEYTRLLFFPLKLSADYPPRPEQTLTARRSIIGILLVSAWIFAALLLLRKAPTASFAIAWSIIMFLPVSNLVPLIHFFVADRFLYVPSFGFCLLLAVGIDRSLDYAGRRNLQWFKTTILALVLILVAAAGLRSAVRNRDWHDEYTLWSSAIRDGCNTIRAHNFLGVALSTQGRFEEAVEHYQEALQLKPGYEAATFNMSEAHNSMGSALLEQGEVDEAIEHCAEAVRLNPGNRDGLNNLATALARQRALDEAGGRTSPGNAKAHNVLGFALLQQGQHDEAIAYLSEALRIDPDYAEAHCNIGLVLARKQKYVEAIDHYIEAIRLNSDYAEPHNNLGVALARHGRLDEAIKHYYEALRINPEYAAAHINLGSALARQGKLDEAIEHYSDALRIDPDLPRADYYHDKIRQLRSPQ